MILFYSFQKKLTHCFLYSDKTGAPHDVAKSHMSMYVNEVGHNMKLVENVEVSYC